MIGANGKGYIQSGTWDAPTWGTEMTSISDTSNNLTWEQIVLATRACKINLYEPGQGELEFPVKMRVSTAADYLALAEACVTRARVDVLMLDGDKATEGTRGFRAQCYVFQKNTDLALASGTFDDFVLKPAVPDVSTRLPQRVSVGSGGTITYTSL